MFLENHLLTLTIFSPLLGIFLISLTPRKFEEGVGVVALFSSLVTLFFTYLLFLGFNPENGISNREIFSWVSSLNINYSVGIDGVSLTLIALTSLLTLLSILVSWNEIKKLRKEFYGLILLCQIGLAGVFSALDLFLFFVFWELMLVPMYFLIGIWGGSNRIYASLKFLLYTLIGSASMLVGIIYLYIVSGNVFNIEAFSSLALSPVVQVWLFLAFGLAFAIKVPIFPFHTWLPDAHTEAPTAGSILLAGVFLKVGAYGFYRIAMPIFPDAVAILRPYILVLAVIGIIYGALVSMMQKDLKRLIAYSSVSHLGFVVLGLITLSPEGVSGASLQLINHGISTGALFLLFGFLYIRSHTRKIEDYSGVARSMPIFAGLFIISGLSSLGLPGLNNFVGEILVLLGTFRTKPLAAVIAASCTIFAAVYILWAIERVFYGEQNEMVKGFKDISIKEIIPSIPLVFLMIFLGVYPNSIISTVKLSNDQFIALASRKVIEAPRGEIDFISPPKTNQDMEIIIPESLKKPGDFYYPSYPASVSGQTNETSDQKRPGEEKYDDKKEEKSGVTQ